MSLLIDQSGVLKAFYVAYRVRNALRWSRADVRQAREIRTQFYLDLWRDAAAQLGASVELLGDEILEIRRGDTSTRVQQNITTIDDPVVLCVAASKPLVHRLLAKHGLRTPAYCEFTLGEIAKAVAFADSIRGECVVKPAGGGGGQGVTTGVTSQFDLLRAAAAATVFGRELLIERQERGDVFRLLYLDGKLLDATLRKPPAITADGKSSVRELVRLENEDRLSKGVRVAHALVQIDMDMRKTLAKQGLELSSIPAEGTEVTLKTVTNDNCQKDNVSAVEMLCKSIIEDGAAAAAAVGVRLAGVDVITTNPAVPLAESGGAILEVNATPSYHHHYYKRDGGYPVAVHILPELLGIRCNETAIDMAVI